jgi:hypothetical protein
MAPILVLFDQELQRVNFNRQCDSGITNLKQFKRSRIEVNIIQWKSVNANHMSILTYPLTRIRQQITAGDGHFGTNKVKGKQMIALV